MNRIILTIFVSAAAALAQVTAPQIGMATDGQGRLRPISGVAGNLIPGAPVVGGVVTAAASDVAALVKTSSEIVVLAKSAKSVTPAPAGAAVFAFAADGSPAFAWLPATRTLLRWTGQQFSPAPLETAAIGGDIVAVGASDPAHLNAAVSRNGTIEIVRIGLSDGAAAETTALPPEARAPMLMPDGSILYAIAGHLVLRTPAATERQIAFPNTASAMVPMSSRWTLVTTLAGRHYAVRLADGAVVQVPEVH